MHSEIAADIGELLRELEALGVRAVDSRYEAEAFGNYVVAFAGAVGPFRIIRDRLEYHLDGPPNPALERAGLWRAFDDLRSFRDVLLAWIGAPET